MAGGFSVTFTGVDRLTGTLDKINKRAERFDLPFKKAQASLAKFSDVSGLTNLSNGLGGVASRARAAFETMSQIVAPLGVITGAASLAGMYRLVASTAELNSKLGFTAQNIGIAAGKLSSLDGAARIAGASAGSMTQGMQTLGQTMFDAVGGRNTDAVVMFNTLGVSFRKSATQARVVADVLPEVANKIAAMKDPYVQARVASTLFGGSAEALLPFLRRGAAGIRELQEAAARYNPVTQRSIDAANQFRESQTRLTMSVEGLSTRLMTALAPAFAPLLTSLADWIATSPQVQAGVDALGQAARRFGDYLRSVDWQAIGQRMLGWWHEGAHVVDALGGVTRILEVFAALMLGRAAVGAATMAGSLLKLGVTVVRVGAMFLPLLATPVGAAVAGAAVAIGALGVAGYELWKHWSAVTGFFSGMWDGLKRAWQNNTGYLRTLTELLFPIPTAIIGHWKPISAFFGSMWDGITTAFKAGWAIVGDIVDRLKKGIDFVANSWLGRKMGWVAQQTGAGISAAGAAVGNAAGSAARGVAGFMDRVTGQGSAPAPSTAAQKAMAQQAMGYFVSQGWSPAQAAGITANLQRESGFNAGAVGDSGNAYGIAQWHKDRQQAIERQFGKSIRDMSFGEQLKAVNYELRQGSEAGAGRAIAMQTTADTAGGATSMYYERPRDRNGEAATRGQMAQGILSAYQQAAPAVSPLPVSGAALAGGAQAGAGGQRDASGAITLRLQHANPAPAGFRASVADTQGSLAGAQIAQANVTGTLP